MVSIFLCRKQRHIQEIKAKAIYSSNQKLYCKYQNPDVDTASIASEIIFEAFDLCCAINKAFLTLHQRP